MAQPFRFGMQVSSAPTAGAWRDLAKKVEDLGFSTLFMPDHLDDQLSPMVALAVAAEATSTLRLGTLVADNDFRHPQVLARELATLDHLSGGRVECGIGAGWLTADYTASGIAYDEPAVRVERLAEAVAVLKGLWTGERFSFAGAHYTLHDARSFPKPSSRPHPKILIGGGSPRVLRLAAAEADIVGINGSLASGHIGTEAIASMAPALFDRRYRWVQEAAGDRFAELEIQCLTFVVNVTPDGAAVRARVAEMFSQPVEELAQVPAVLIGDVEEICDTLQARRARWGYSYVVVHEQEMDDFAPVVARLTGA